MCSERDSPLEPAPGQPELARLTCGAHLVPPVLTRKQKRPRVNSLVCDRAAAFFAAGPPEVLSRMSRPVMQAAERERELARARNQRLKQAAPSLPGESVLRGFADRGALEGYPSHYTYLLLWTTPADNGRTQQPEAWSFPYLSVGDATAVGLAAMANRRLPLRRRTAKKKLALLYSDQFASKPFTENCPKVVSGHF